MALWAYLAVVMFCQNRTTSGWWKGYDMSLRHSYSSIDEANFLLNQYLFMQAMVENSEPLQRVTPPGVAPQRPQKKEGSGLLRMEQWQSLHINAMRFSHTCVPLPKA